MKIAYIIPSLAKSGPVNVVYQLVKSLSKEHEIVIYYFKTLENREILPFNILTKHIKFFDKINFDQYDIIHTHGIKADAYVWWHYKDINRAKTVTTLHNYVKEDLAHTYGNKKSFFLVKLWNLVTSKHDQVVVLSKDAVKYYKTFWRNQEIVHVYNGIPVPTSLQSINVKKNSKYIKVGAIASAGGINSNKGMDQVIKALPYLLNYTFFIAGKETEAVDRLKYLAKQLKVEDRVMFLGYQSNIDAFIGEMDLFVVSPRSEGFSLALQEIISHKKPVVCSDISIFRELFSDREVRFFTLDDIHVLVKIIKAMESTNQTMIDNAYRKFLLNYTTEKMTENYMQIYNTLIKVS